MFNQLNLSIFDLCLIRPLFNSTFALFDLCLVRPFWVWLELTCFVAGAHTTNKDDGAAKKSLLLDGDDTFWLLIHFYSQSHHPTIDDCSCHLIRISIKTFHSKNLMCHVSSVFLILFDSRHSSYIWKLVVKKLWKWWHLWVFLGNPRVPRCRDTLVKNHCTTQNWVLIVI